MAVSGNYSTVPVSLRFPAPIIARVKQHSARALVRYSVFIQNATVKELNLVEKEWAARQAYDKPKKRKRNFAPHTHAPLPSARLEPEPLDDPEPEPSFAPAPSPPPAPPPPISTASRIARQVTKIFEEQAAVLFKVLDKPTEKRIVVIETINRIRKTAPLTHPSDAVIISKLEELVTLLQDKAEASKPAPKPEQIIDTNAVATVGDSL